MIALTIRRIFAQPHDLRAPHIKQYLLRGLSNTGTQGSLRVEGQVGRPFYVPRKWPGSDPARIQRWNTHDCTHGRQTLRRLNDSRQGAAR
jgi:hypothetical protein